MTVSNKKTLDAGWMVALVAVVAGAAAIYDAVPRPPPCGAGKSACGLHPHGGAAAAPGADPAIGEGPRLVVFSSAYCPACERMKPVLAEIERDCDVSRSMSHVDVDGAGGDALAARYAVTSLPTFLSVDASGREVVRLEGIQSRETLERSLEDIRGERCASTKRDGRSKAM